MKANRPTLTLAQVKRRLQVGVQVTMTWHLHAAERPNLTQRAALLSGQGLTRPVSKVQTNAVTFADVDHTGKYYDSWLWWPKAADFRADGPDLFTIMDKGQPFMSYRIESDHSRPPEPEPPAPPDPAETPATQPATPAPSPVILQPAEPRAPYEMTQQEYHDWRTSEQYRADFGQIHADRQENNCIHREKVKAALDGRIGPIIYDAAGNPLRRTDPGHFDNYLRRAEVPARVLADYPDLTADPDAQAREDADAAAPTAEILDAPAYRAERIDGKWYATRRGEIASEPQATQAAAEQEATRRLAADLRIEDSAPIGHTPSPSEPPAPRCTCEHSAQTRRTLGPRPSCPVHGMTAPFPIPTAPRTPSPDEPEALRRAFGTKPPRPLRPAQQDELFNPLPQMRLSFNEGGN